MANNGICIGGKCAGDFYSSDSNFLRALPRVAISPVTDFANAQMYSADPQEYVWAPIRLHWPNDYVQVFGFWRHVSINDDASAFRELILNYRPIEAVDILSVHKG